MKLPPWFYVLAVVAVVVAALGWRLRVGDKKLAYAAIILLGLDVCALWFSLAAYCGPFVMMDFAPAK